MDLRNKIINHPEKGRIIPLGLLGYIKVRTLINDDLLLIPVGGAPCMMILKKGEFQL